HNIKYDWLVLRRAGVELAGVAYDSMLASFVLDPGRRSHAIDDLARERLSLQVQTYADVAGRGRSERPFAAVPLADAARHACGDSETVLRLREAFRPELEDHQLLGLLEQVEVPLIAVLVEMEWRGVRVDLERLREISRQFSLELAELEGAIYRAATGRLSSSDPNLQNIPVRTPRGEAIRRAFVAAPGWLLLTADYSQIELRLLAHLSGDPAFVRAFAEGGDIHRQTAAIIFAVPQEQVTPEMRARHEAI